MNRIDYQSLKKGIEATRTGSHQFLLSFHSRIDQKVLFLIYKDGKLLEERRIKVNKGLNNLEIDLSTHGSGSFEVSLNLLNEIHSTLLQAA